MEFIKVEKQLQKEDLVECSYPNQRIGVIVHIVDRNGRILLQKRGPKSRDENGLFENVGGSVEDTDIDYKSAIVREIQEEMGNNVHINLTDSIGIYHCEKGTTNWLFVIFLGYYIGGNIEIMEPEKCLGYRFFDYEEAIFSPLVSESCKFLIKSLKK